MQIKHPPQLCAPQSYDKVVKVNGSRLQTTKVTQLQTFFAARLVSLVMHLNTHNISKP